MEIGHDLGMTVVAEGVETIEQLEFLRSIGCDVVQGYLFSRPSPSSNWSPGSNATKAFRKLLKTPGHRAS